MMESKGAIFDVDGTLLDSMPVWHNIGELYLESLGITCEKDLGDKIYAMSLEQGASYLRKEYHLEKSESEIIHEVLKIVDDFYRLEAPLKPGVRKVLDWFRNHGIPMAVATSGNRALALAALERTGLQSIFRQCLHVRRLVQERISLRFICRQHRLLGVNRRRRWYLRMHFMRPVQHVKLVFL